MDREIRYLPVCDKYEISSDGRVFSKDFNHTGKRKEMRQYLDQDGYPHIFFNVNGRRFKRMVHRLVAESFLVKPPSDCEINHKNGTRNDNRLENLEWVTHQENVLHGFRVNGREISPRQRESISLRVRGEGNPKAKLDIPKVRQLRLFRREGMLLKDLANLFNISVSQAGAIAQGRSWGDTPNFLLEVAANA